MLVVAAVGVVLWRAGREPTRSNPVATASTSESSSLSPAEQDAVRQILAVYKGYLDVSTRQAVAGQFQSAELLEYATDPLLSETAVLMQNQKGAGQVYQGTLVSQDPRVSALDLNATPRPKATVTDCIDASNYRLVNKANGSPAAAPGGTRRFVVESTVLYISGKGWRISESGTDKARPC
jgi:hypothetical protein